MFILFLYISIVSTLNELTLLRIAKLVKVFFFFFLRRNGIVILMEN